MDGMSNNAFVQQSDACFLPTNDLVFRKLFGTPENICVIVGFLKDFFGIIVTEQQVRVVNPYSIRDYDNSDLREIKRDATLTIIDTAEVTIEMQVNRQVDFPKRAVHYAADLFTSNYGKVRQTDQSSSATKYQALKPVWSMNILGYRFFADDDALRVFSLRNNKTGELYPGDLLRIGFFELAKTPETPALAAWRHFFQTGQALPDAPDYIKEAAKIVQKQNFTPEERRMLSVLERNQADDAAKLAYAHQSGIDIGFEKGIEKGIEKVIEKGIEKGTRVGLLKAARSMLIEGLKPEQVARILDLPLDQVIALR